MARRVVNVHYNEKLSSWYTQFRYEDKRGNRQRKKKCGFKTQAEAKAWMERFIEDAKKTDTISFERIVELYIAYIEKRVKESTMVTKKNIIYAHILPFFKEYELGDIDTELLSEWQDSVKENKFSGTYLKSVQSQMKAILNYAYKMEYTSEQLANRLEPMGSSKAPEMQIWSVEEFNQFARYTKDAKPELYYPIFLAYWSGMRLGEIMALKVKNLDFENKELWVKQTFYRKEKVDKYTTTKTDNSYRKIKLPAFVVNEMQEYLNMQYCKQPNDKLFIRSKGFYEKAFPEYINLAGVKRIRIHDLRHSHASNLIAEGVDAATVADRLGDTVKTILNTYVHALDTKRNYAADVLERLNNENMEEI